ncbi:ankyrin [Acephala macrosclerotiorum]|nr:ankyrin [Acephala macrosclerotiorum]
MRSQMVRGEAPPPWSSIEVLFDYLVKILSMFREAFLVIDALYECRVDEQRALFRIIRKLSETNRGFVLHIFVTSRTTIEILDEMRLLNALEIQIGGRETDVDIRIFIESEIHNNVQLKRLPRALVEEMVSTLLQNSHGMILYAALALRSLRHFPGLTVKRVRESLNRTPRGLSELYRSLLYGIHDDCKPFAIAVITWLCTSFEPMPITALWEAISFNPKASADDELLIDPEELPLLLNGLARVINDKILLIHPTAAEELRRIRYEVGQSISEFGVYEKDAQLSLASTCLRYIVHYTESERRLNSTQDFEAFPLLKYACRFWMGHTRRWAEVSRLDEGAENGELGVLVKSILSSAESIEAWTSIFDPEDPERDAFGPRRTGAPASPVFYAIKSGINEAVAGVLQGGADASARTRDGRRPLHVAVMERNMPMVSMLLDHGASTTATDSNGEMPLLEAAYSGQEDLTALLCQHTESREVIQENSEGLSILHRLAQDPEATGPIFLLFLEPRSTSHQSRILLESLLNVRDRELCTPLHHAVKAENIAVATVLLQQGADINAKNKNGDTPLHFAAEFDPRGSWELLIDYGAVVTVENNKQLTPLTATWSKKSLPWSSYMEDTELSRGMTHNTKVLKKVPNSPGPALPQHIFRKVYNLDREKNEDLKFVVTSLACENRLFQRLDHPHIVSYLGCEAFGTNEPKLYLEYCNGGDPGYYVEPLTPTEISHNHKLPTSQEDEEHEELGNLKWGKMEVWRLIYQLFAALAHLHYGVSISGREKDCRYELGWDPAFHCDIKPNNVVLKETNGECEAKICDLGTAGDLITGPKSRSGTKGWRPPELDTMKRRNWSTKGDVWALGSELILEIIRASAC